MKTIYYIIPIVFFILCSCGTTSRMTYSNGYILDSEGKVLGNYANGHIFDTQRNIKGYYANGYIYDKSYKIKGTYNNGFVKMNYATDSIKWNESYGNTKHSGVPQCNMYSDVFHNVHSLCNIDNGKLWGINLHAPILCIDTNRTVWSNMKDKNGELLFNGNCYVGKYPNDKNIANSIMEVFGQKWVTIALPFPSDSIERNTLFCHEMFHYWQDSLGHTTRIYNNVHIDSKDARTLLKLEWQAFYAACKATDYLIRKNAILDGLVFRKIRQGKYVEYYPDETAFEIHEGLAQYTGRKMAVLTDSIYLRFLEQDMDAYMGKEDLVRNYAYLSGVMLGYLLDKSGNDWRRQINGNSDLGLMLQSAYNINLPSNMDMHFQESKDNYAYDEIISFEDRRDSIKTIKRRQLVELFTHNIKKLPLKNMQISFDPNSVVPLEGIGNIYGKARIIDNWGILETIDDGVVLISNDWKTVIIPYADRVVTKGNVEETDKWKLTKKNNNISE